MSTIIYITLRPTLINISGQLLLSLCPAYNMLHASIYTSGFPLFLNAAPCSLFSSVQRLCVTVSCANMFGLILVRYSKPIHSIGSGLERWDLRRRIEPVSRPNCKGKYWVYKVIFVTMDLVQNYYDSVNKFKNVCSSKAAMYVLTIVTYQLVRVMCVQSL